MNVSIATGVFPSAFKKALVTPLLKKTTLDANDVKNYRPVSNLCFVSKIVEKVVNVRLSKHLSDNDLYEQMQPAYRPNHSTQTALLRVPNDLLYILDERKAAILVLLDISAAFDTIDHTIMLTRLRDRFGITATCLESYLVNRSQCRISAERPVHTQKKTQSRQSHASKIVSQNYKIGCININKLKCNATKTDIIVMCAPHVKIKLSMPHIKLGDTVVPVSTVAKNIGVFFDDALSMNNQVQHICRVAYFHIHCIGKIRNLLDRKTTEIMIHTYVTSRLDN